MAKFSSQRRNANMLLLVGLLMLLAQTYTLFDYATRPPAAAVPGGRWVLTSALWLLGAGYAGWGWRLRRTTQPDPGGNFFDRF